MTTNDRRVAGQVPSRTIEVRWDSATRMRASPFQRPRKRCQRNGSVRHGGAVSTSVASVKVTTSSMRSRVFFFGVPLLLGLGLAITALGGNRGEAMKAPVGIKAAAKVAHSAGPMVGNAGLSSNVGDVAVRGGTAVTDVPAGAVTETTTTPPPAPKFQPVAAQVPARGEATAYGCGPALAYLAAYEAPGFSASCPAYSEGYQATTSCAGTDCSAGERLITITVPCAAAYMNEASNSWVLSGLTMAPIDPYGYCH